MQRWFWVIGVVMLVLSGLAGQAGARDVVQVNSERELMRTLKKAPDGFPNGSDDLRLYLGWHD